MLLLDKNILLSKDLLLSSFEDDYGYFKEKGYFKWCSLENVDVDCVAVFLHSLSTQYLTFQSDDIMGDYLTNHALLDENVRIGDQRADEVINKIDGRIYSVDLMKRGFSMILLEKHDDGAFYEVSTGQKILTSPVCFSVSPLDCWDDFNEIYSQYLKEDLDCLFDSPVVFSGKYLFEVNREERDIIERYIRNCYKDVLKSKFKRMKANAIKENEKALTITKSFISSLNLKRKYVFNRTFKF